ncbi:G8 domain-containing protein [Myxococcus landrumensis]|uniref:G8 domain-containing protein n=1 Tax=Myxococcus landrumensis TaxID=2813577 RepID=A0ABX7NJT2_9BACT|nr:G8 domain-containing protein [Myxococcus landrumus]QSQ17656.1 G8 domain-containing protein [Myxococcus landrumus]
MKTFMSGWVSLLAVAVVSSPGDAGAVSRSSASSAVSGLPNGSFETPALPASPGYQTAPAGSGWTFVNGAGFSRNNTAFTSGNPVAPQGAQVLFLQGVASASQTWSLPAGSYVFSFMAAQRGNLPSTQQLELRVDGSPRQSFTPTGATYQRFTSAPLYLASGAHTVALHGLNPQGTDSTAFVDDFSVTRVRDVALSGFESPALPASPGYAYAPAGGPWTFEPGAGLSRNATAFTVGNPVAPEGGQVLFLQGASSASINVAVPRGYHRFRLKAALRGTDPTQPPAKDLVIAVNGTQVGHFRPASTQYVEQVSTVLWLEAGTVTVRLTGVDTGPGDHTGLVDDLRLESVHDWKDPLVWGGTVPGPSDDATVVLGSAVCIDGVLNPRSITVMGELLGVQNRNVDVTTQYVMVMGVGSLLELGQERTPYPSKATFTLNATDTQLDLMGMGNNFLGAMGSGTLHLHGEERVSWTRLSQNVAAGATDIYLAQPVNWRAGDSIVVVSSHLDWNEAEQRTIATVHPGGTRVTLSSALSFAHSGVVKTFSSPTRSWTADLRAEVGLLTHNIVVKGHATLANASGFGGHIMVMDKSRAYVSGVELANMGQKAKLGRYPFHWHMLAELGEGQYFRSSSVHHSYNRAITIHGTESTRVENNFFYDHIGHGVFLEDGSERFNVIKGNVTLLTRRPKPLEAVTPSDHELDVIQNRTPASYWITNPENTFEDNVAAGTQGTGFWFAFPTKPMGASENHPRFKDLKPDSRPLISFKGNSAHSTMSGFDIYDRLTPGHSIQPNWGWNDDSPHLIENSTWYANALGIYTGIGVGGPTDNLIFRNNILVDNVWNSMLASYSVIEQSVFVADSGANLLPGGIERFAYRVYDGAGQVRDSHFLGWDAPNANLLLNTGAAVKHPNHLFTNNTVSPAGPPRISLENFDIPPTKTTGVGDPGHPRYWSIAVRDTTGGITGKPNTTIVSSQPFMRVGDEYRPAHWTNTYRSDHRFVMSRLTYLEDFPDTPNIACTREKAGTPTAHVFYIDNDGYREWHQLPFIVNEGFEYTYAYQSLPPGKQVTMTMEDASVGDFYVARFKDFGKLGNLRFFSNQASFTPHTSLPNLRAATSSGYYVQPGGDVYVKAVATGKTQGYILYWDTPFAVPPLDTDGDQVTDAVEISRSRHPFDASDLLAGFDTAGDFEDWTVFANVAGQGVAGGVLTGTSTGNGDAMVVNSAYHFAASRVPTIQLRMKATQGTGVQLFFATDTQPGFSAARVANGWYTGGGAYQVVTLDMAAVPGWSGTITDLRLDPVSGAGIQFDIDSIRGPGL